MQGMLLLTHRQTSDGSSSYLGEFSGGKRHGQGKQKDATGKYKGWWELDVRHGPGILIQNVCMVMFVSSVVISSLFAA